MGITIKTNGHARDLLAYVDLTPAQREDVEFYMGAPDADNEEHYALRFFIYRGATYDVHEFERAWRPDLEAWDGAQGESYFSAVLVRYTDHFDGVIVGYAHW